MGMPITVEVLDRGARPRHLGSVFRSFRQIDERFSPFKETSETTLWDRGLLKSSQASLQMKVVLQLAEETKQASGGYFDVYRDGRFNPVGIVKGWAIHKAAGLLRQAGFADFYVEAGGDAQVCGRRPEGKPWLVGIRNPFDPCQIIKVLRLSERGVATSGTYFRGHHIYDPLEPAGRITEEPVSLTVIAADVLDADRFATAAFAMGQAGIAFIEGMDGCEGYVVDGRGIATYTTGFASYVAADDR
jgi:thiamine biosynthesis lipoprotein